MGFLKAFNTPKNQKFEYHPRYWDPKKEEWEERKKELHQLQEKDNSPEAMKMRIAKGMRRGGRADTEYRSALVRRSNIRLLGIIGILILLSYIAIKIYLPQLLNSL